jgi:hypothetical protein
MEAIIKPIVLNGFEIWGPSLLQIDWARLERVQTLLSEPLRGLVKAFKPRSLQDAIIRTREMEYAVSKNKIPSKPLLP